MVVVSRGEVLAMLKPNMQRARCDFNEDCTVEHDTALYRLAVTYSRAPERRRETEKPVVDDTEKTALQHRRDSAVFTEFSFRWNAITGALP